MAPIHNSDSDDGKTLQPSDGDVLRDEEDMERLLQTPKSTITSLFAGSNDPNQPRELSLTKREIRRKRRRERRARNRQGKKGDEAALMFEMEEGARRSSDDSGSTSSEDNFANEKPSKTTRRRTCFHFVFIPAALVSLLFMISYGAYKMSGRSNATKSTQKVLRSNGTHTFAPTTILVSLDGFRADFLQRGLTPALSRFIKEGVSPKYMLPSFPSVTFPNHWTLVTGLYPESHGVVGNTFWDPDMKEQFHNTVPSQSMFPKWWISTGAEPIWATAEGHGIRSAIHMWPGSEAHVQPEATYLDKFNGSEVLSLKVDRVLELLDRPSEFDSEVVAYTEARPQFVAIYVPDVDSDGHLYGPNSTEIRETITSVDTMLQGMFDGLEQRNLTGIVNIVVVSDHGMATTSNDRLIQLEDMIDVDEIEHIDGWPLYGLRPKAGVDIKPIYAKLKAEAAKHTHFEVYLKANMPPRWHFSQSDRIAPLWVIPETGWAVVHKADFDVAVAQKDGTIYHPRGLHGYDHEHPLMRAIFVARGPSFPHTPNSELAVFQNTEVYNIVCDSLDLEPKANNGTLRLPLKPIGLHSETEDEVAPVDLPTSTGGTSRTEVAASNTPTAAVPTATSDSVEDKAEHIEKHQTGFWDAMRERIKEALHRLISAFKHEGQQSTEEGSNRA